MGFKTKVKSMVPQTRPVNAEQPSSFSHHNAYGLPLSGSHTKTRTAFRWTIIVHDKGGARRDLYFTQPRFSAATEETSRRLPGRVSLAACAFTDDLTLPHRIIGFLFGFSLASTFAAYHLLDEYKTASAALQASVEELQASTEKVWDLVSKWNVLFILCTSPSGVCTCPSY